MVGGRGWCTRHCGGMGTPQRPCAPLADQRVTTSQELADQIVQKREADKPDQMTALEVRCI